MGFAERRSCRVAVIGAGAAGLVAARELEREGHSVVVYEQSDGVGGTWAYTGEVEDDPLGLRPDRKRVHSSLYASLRTNFPREVMGFLDFPFLPKEGRDGRRYPGHPEVLSYLEDFAEHYGLRRLILFGRRVERVAMCPPASGLQKSLGDDTYRCSLMENGDTIWEDAGDEGSAGRVRWSILSRPASFQPLSRSADGGLKEEIFDAVVLCVGRYSQPTIAEIPGIERWPGKQLHSHNYRVPETYKGQVVIIIGNAASGQDISSDIAKTAKEVHWSGRTWMCQVDMSQPIGASGNIWLHFEVDSVHEDGTVTFHEGAHVLADVIVHCTGYSYSFPSLDTQGIVTVDDNCVAPLYQHVFPPALAPTLSFVGLPWKIIPFSLFELQSRWISQCLAGKAHLASRKHMTEATEYFYASLEANQIPKRYTHRLAISQIL